MDLGTLAATVEAISKRKLALVVGDSAFTAASAVRICELVAKHPMPAIADGQRFADGGLLLSYSTDFVELYKRGADYVARILRFSVVRNPPICRSSMLLATNLSST